LPGFIFLILRGLAIALEASTLFSRLLAGAVTLIFFTYAFVNMGMVSGILPVVGVPLPFISYGGTAMVTLGAGLGILMSIAKAKRLDAAMTMLCTTPVAVVGIGNMGLAMALRLRDAGARPCGCTTSTPPGMPWPPRQVQCRRRRRPMRRQAARC
jgi:hypothetical protein